VNLRDELVRATQQCTICHRHISPADSNGAVLIRVAPMVHANIPHVCGACGNRIKSFLQILGVEVRG
jgi:hypothetical protein